VVGNLSSSLPLINQSIVMTKRHFMDDDSMVAFRWAGTLIIDVVRKLGIATKMAILGKVLPWTGSVSPFR